MISEWLDIYMKNLCGPSSAALCLMKGTADRGFVLISADMSSDGESVRYGRGLWVGKGIALGTRVLGRERHRAGYEGSG